MEYFHQICTPCSHSNWIFPADIRTVFDIQMEYSLQLLAPCSPQKLNNPGRIISCAPLFRNVSRGKCCLNNFNAADDVSGSTQAFVSHSGESVHLFVCWLKRLFRPSIPQMMWHYRTACSSVIQANQFTSLCVDWKCRLHNFSTTHDVAYHRIASWSVIQTNQFTGFIHSA